MRTAIIIIALLMTGCTKLVVYRSDGSKLAEYVRPSWTDFQAEVELTSGTLNAKTGSHLNETMMTIPARLAGFAEGVAR